MIEVGRIRLNWRFEVQSTLSRSISSMTCI